MNSKALLLAGLLAVALVLAGLFADRSSSYNTQADNAREVVLAGLSDRINDVSEIVIKTASSEYHVKRQAETWVLVEKDGYPVQVDNVRAALMALAELKTVERKTDNPERHGKLGVQSVGSDPQAEDQPKRVDLLDVSGETMASLILGKDRSGGQGGTFYARRPAEMAAWLVEGRRPSFPDDGDDWLDKKIVELKRGDVSAVRTTNVDGTLLTISKEAGETNFTVHDLPADRELSYDAVAGSVAGALQYINFEDVQKAASFEAPEEPLSVTSFWTIDGMRMTVTLWEIEEKFYASFEATYDLQGTPKLEVGPMPAPEEGEAAVVATPRDKAEVEAEVAELNGRLKTWVFQLPAYSKSNLTKTVNSMLKPLPEPEEEETPTPEEGETVDIDTLGGNPGDE